jgi:tripartite-type tricarboxylate transporter receptor subunit TctC
MTKRMFMLAFAALTLAASPLLAQDYPNKPIKLIVPFAPGAGNDVMARFAAHELAPRLGQPIVVENKPGAGSQTGIDLVAKSPADGYTLVWVASDGISILPAVKANVPYKIPDDFSFIAGITTFPFIVMVSNSLPIKTMKDLEAYGKANPGKLRYGSSGVGSGPHLTNAVIGATTGISMVHVPFQGGAPALTALMGGHVDMAASSPSLAKPAYDSKQVRAIATTGPTRHPQFPDVPTMAESGYPSLTSVLIFGAMAPAGVPEPILARLRTEFAEMLKDPKAAEKLRQLGYEPEYYGGDVFKDFVVKDLERWKAVAKAANISIRE